MAHGKRWTRDELLLALNLYRKIRFGQFHGRNPVIIDLAEKMDRSPSSLAMKLCNFASLDPLLQARGIRGLEGASSLDRAMWLEFQANPLEIATGGEEALRDLFRAQGEEEVEVDPTRGIRLTVPVGPTETVGTVKLRRVQRFFREMIVNAFEGKCCITGLPVRSLLVASHILPWSKFPNERVNPQNGLCLSRLHDAAFDAGLITFDPDMRLVMSRKLKGYLPEISVEQNFAAYERSPINLPADAIPPSEEFLRYHRTEIFKN